MSKPLIPTPKQLRSKPDQELRALKTKTFVGFRPHPGQVRIIKAIENNGVKHTVLSIGRQFGKSMMARNLCYKWCINTENQDVYYVTPTYGLAKDIFEKIEKEIGESGVLKEGSSGGAAGISRSDLTFRFKNGSSIRLRSGERPENLRGVSCTHLIIDEMAFTKRDLWEKVLAPATKVKGKKVLFISSPAGKNHFYELFERGRKGEPGFQSFSAASTENPYIDPNELIEAQKNDLVWRSEYLAEFVDDALSVFPKVEEAIYGPLIQPMMAPIATRYYAGIDLAKKHDFSVITVIDEHRKVVDIFRINRTSWDAILNALVEMLVFWKPALTYIETNHNDKIYEDLIYTHNLKNVNPFNTNVGTKNPLIEELVVAFEKGLVKIPNTEYLVEELKKYTFVYKKETGRLSYGAPSGSNDDCVISLALANAAWNNKHPKAPMFILDKL